MGKAVKTERPRSQQATEAFSAPCRTEAEDRHHPRHVYRIPVCVVGGRATTLWRGAAQEPEGGLLPNALEAYGMARAMSSPSCGTLIPWKN